MSSYLIITECPLFVECNVGYVGKNCSIPCPYNSYGERCQMTCNCTKDECDFIRGCAKKEIGNWFIILYPIITVYFVMLISTKD